MSIKLLNCDCLFEESGKGIGKVKGYIKVSECNDCKIKRENNAIIAEQNKLESEKEMKIQEEMQRILREQAIKNLVDRGEI